MQDRSVPAISVASIDASAGQRMRDETDGAWPLLAPVPWLPALDVFPAGVPLPVAPTVAPTAAAPTELLVLCTTLLAAAALPVALLPAVLNREFVPVVLEEVLADELALLPTGVLFDALEGVPAAPVVVPVVCARAGVARTADRTRAVVRMRMAIHRCLCHCQRRPVA